MSRVGKCDVCRWRKIKCDNLRPVCGPCNIKGRPCSYQGRRIGTDQFDKQAETDQPDLRLLATKSHGGVPVQTWRLKSSSPKRPKLTNEPSRFLISEALRLTHRWLPFVRQDSPFEIFGLILRAVPTRIGSSPVLDAAATSLVREHQAFLTADRHDIDAARRAYDTAYKSLRKALLNTSLKDEDQILISIAVRLVADAGFSSDADFRPESESLSSEDLNNMQALPHHMHINTICHLLRDRWRNGRGSQIDRLLLQAVFYGEISGAIGADEASILDEDIRLEVMQRLSPHGFSQFDAAFETVMNQLIKLPRIIRLVRHCDIQRDVADHAYAILSMITNMYEVRVEPLAIRVAESSDSNIEHEAIPKTELGSPIHFASVSDFILAINYCAYRLICCGLLQRLHSMNIYSEYPKIADVWVEEIETAEFVARTVQYAFLPQFNPRWPALRLGVAASISYSAWSRLEKRSSGRPDMLEKAASMKKFCLFLTSRTLGLSVEPILAFASEIYTGGPLSKSFV